ncbi:aldolase catalytic domain-containing protein [Paenibacillus rubinfantis]|uniref:aldolase catalytic domain-containing protein n=1 Tax=Paenibacillus rubinfantis TaxID=1720296 RepID=UPI00073F2FE5|nr:aldolase catalytic domain-containing protein [Paenibacillus rubinfantis]
MKTDNITVLDCTLRDGGYINDWQFGEFNIKRIITALSSSNIDIVECGYLNTIKGQGFFNSTMFQSINQVENILQSLKTSAQHVVMVNHGEYDLTTLQPNLVRGIRYAFHKAQWEEALEQVAYLVNKGFYVFVQPMVTLNYSDDELLRLISETNKINPYAFYIVDSFGAMKKEDILRLTTLVHHNLNTDIQLGYHSHNNLQLAFSNALEFLEFSSKRKLILDTSVFGMGRGAGNLPTELLVNYLNENTEKNYKIEPLLNIMDKCIARIYSQKKWGYSTAHYLSAIYNCHPNYSNYLINKNTLSVGDIEQILKKMEPSKKVSFDKKYIEEQYIEYNSKLFIENDDLIELKQLMMYKDILIIAPGISVISNIDYIKNVQQGKLSISINHAVDSIVTDYYFFSNQRRFDDYVEKITNNILQSNDKTFIFTSNIRHHSISNKKIIVDYQSVLDRNIEGSDNSAILLLSLLKSMRVDEVFIAGLDGYSHKDSSYIYEDMDLIMDVEEVAIKNKLLKTAIDYLSKEVRIHFITESKYQQ